MKKLFAILCGAALLLLLVGCNPNEEVKMQPFMVKVEECGSFYICYQRDTKVMYAVSCSSYSRGNVSVLLDADGTPMLWEGADLG